jgi:signal transduction histidine kinase
MRRLSLRTLLILLNVGLVTGALVAVVTAAAIDLRRLANDQGLARARLAATGARQALRLAGEDVVAAARQAQERPGLHTALASGDREALRAFVTRARIASGYSGCALVRGGQLLAANPPDLPWDNIVKSLAGTPAAGWFLGPRVGDVPFLIVGTAPSEKGEPSAGLEPAPATSAGQTLVIMTRLADHDFQRSLTAQGGLKAELLGWREISEEASDRASLRQRALEEGRPIAARLDSTGAFLALEPVTTRGGAPEALIETTLPTAEVDAAVRSLFRSVLAVGIIAGGVAGLLGASVARRLTRPIEDLTRATTRIGRGDLTTPIPRPAETIELGELAGSMEEMRGRLLELTAESRRRRKDAEAILGGISEGVYAVDRERRFRFLNKQTADLLGIDPKDALGRFCGDVLNPQGPDGIRPCEDNCPILDARFRGGARSTERLLLKDGSMRTVVIASAPPAASREEEMAADGLGGDTLADRQFQLIRDETEIEATRRLRDAVLANITHEFRTPLSAQLASLELLRERLPENATPETLELLSSLERGALRLTQLIDNLLESVRLDAGHADIRRQPLNLDEVIEEAAQATAPLLDLRGQRLEVDLPYPLPPVVGDAPRLVQVFVNLIANANKFAPTGTVIKVGGEADRASVTLWVEDQGPGFPAEDGVLLFEPFTRSPGEEPEQSGMGLGLYIVKSIVERHGGHVEARPAGGRGGRPGAPAPTGARLSVTLPFAAAAAERAEAGGAKLQP